MGALARLGSAVDEVVDDFWYTGRYVSALQATIKTLACCRCGLDDFPPARPASICNPGTLDCVGNCDCVCPTPCLLAHRARFFTSKICAVESDAIAGQWRPYVLNGHHSEFL